MPKHPRLIIQKKYPNRQLLVTANSCKGYIMSIIVKTQNFEFDTSKLKELSKKQINSIIFFLIHNIIVPQGPLICQHTLIGSSHFYRFMQKTLSISSIHNKEYYKGEWKDGEKSGKGIYYF